jgi:hypothetical protein
VRGGGEGLWGKALPRVLEDQSTKRPGAAPNHALLRDEPAEAVGHEDGRRGQAAHEGSKVGRQGVKCTGHLDAWPGSMCSFSVDGCIHSPRTRYSGRSMLEQASRGTRRHITPPLTAAPSPTKKRTRRPVAAALAPEAGGVAVIASAAQVREEALPPAPGGVVGPVDEDERRAAGGGGGGCGLVWWGRAGRWWLIMAGGWRG